MDGCQCNSFRCRNLARSFDSTLLKQKNSSARLLFWLLLLQAHVHAMPCIAGGGRAPGSRYKRTIQCSFFANATGCQDVANAEVRANLLHVRPVTLATSHHTCMIPYGVMGRGQCYGSYILYNFFCIVSSPSYLWVFCGCSSPDFHEARIHTRGCRGSDSNHQVWWAYTSVGTIYSSLRL